jgi:hypothetical protein
VAAKADEHRQRSTGRAASPGLIERLMQPTGRRRQKARPQSVADLVAQTQTKGQPKAARGKLPALTRGKSPTLRPNIHSNSSIPTRGKSPAARRSSPAASRGSPPEGKRAGSPAARLRQLRRPTGAVRGHVIDQVTGSQPTPRTVSSLGEVRVMALTCRVVDQASASELEQTFQPAVCDHSAQPANHRKLNIIRHA